MFTVEIGDTKEVENGREESVVSLLEIAGKRIDDLTKILSRKRSNDAKKKEMENLAASIFSRGTGENLPMQRRDAPYKKNLRGLTKVFYEWPRFQSIRFLVLAPSPSAADDTSSKTAMKRSARGSIRVKSRRSGRYSAPPIFHEEVIEEEPDTEDTGIGSSFAEESASDANEMLKAKVIDAIRNCKRFRSYHADRILSLLGATRIDTGSQTSSEEAASQGSNFSDELQTRAIVSVEGQDAKVEKKFSFLKLMTEANLSSYQAQAVNDEFFQAPGLSSRNLRRLALMVPNFVQAHLERELACNEPFSLHVDGSKLGPNKFITFTIRWGVDRCFIFGFLQVPRETVLDVLNAFQEHMSKFSAAAREFFAKNVRVFRIFLFYSFL